MKIITSLAFLVLIGSTQFCFADDTDQDAKDAQPKFTKDSPTIWIDEESEVVGIRLRPLSELDEDQRKLLLESGLIDQSELAKATASSVAPNPPVITTPSDGDPFDIHFWVKGDWDSRADLFYQSWHVDTEAWLTTNSNQYGPPYVANRIVAWYSHVCNRKSEAIDNSPRLYFRDSYTHHGPPPPGTGMCPPQNVCFRMCALTDLGSGCSRTKNCN